MPARYEGWWRLWKQLFNGSPEGKGPKSTFVAWLSLIYSSIFHLHIRTLSRGQVPSWTTSFTLESHVGPAVYRGDGSVSAWQSSVWGGRLEGSGPKLRCIQSRFSFMHFTATWWQAVAILSAFLFIQNLQSVQVEEEHERMLGERA